MFRHTLSLVLILICHVLLAEAAFAQEVSGCKSDFVRSLSSIQTDGNHFRYSGTAENPVQVDCDDMQLFATSIEIYRAEGRVLAFGDVVFISGQSRISAERMEFDTKTKTGTFYNASGTTVIRDQQQTQPQLQGTQEPNAFFWGEELRKIGPKKYQIMRGGFTACVQPTPRWDVASGNITLNLDDYALLRNSVFRVKGVPLMYLPVFYYPIQEDDRATGFLMPIYGSATQKGQSITNQFFWAIGRSHDATFSHDWFSKAGQGYGGEYNYVLAPGSSGNARVHVLNERAISAEQATAALPQRDARRSFNINGGMSQALPNGWRAQGNANYFSSLTTQQRYQQDINLATDRRRSFGGALTGNLREYVVSARMDQYDYFDSANRFTRVGSLPRINVGRGEQALGKSQIYFGLNSEFVTLVNRATADDVETRNQGLTRFDITPTVRVPFRKWPFFTVNSSASWRHTYWTESLNPAGSQVEESISRRYFDLIARTTGPVFTRIFDTPDSGYATRWKHVIEPSFTIRRTTAVENVDRIVILESATDYVIGDVTEYRYGVTNRLYAKKEVAREVLNVGVSQTYYTDPNAARYDQNYESSQNSGLARRTNFSPVSLLARVSPTDRVQGQFRTEWDPTVHTLRTLSASGSFGNGSWLDTSAGWSLRRHIPQLPGFNNPASATHALNGSATLRTYSSRFGGTYSFDYDFKRSFFLQQRILTYYNAQCCGFTFEWQTFNLSGVPGILVPQDRRFNVSFSLAGIGTFSNFFGALSGQERRR